MSVNKNTIKRFAAIRAQTIKDAKSLNSKNKKLIALGISGSAREKFDLAAEDSNSEFLLKKALGQLEKQGVATELVALRHYGIKHCKACYSTTNTQCHFPCSCYPKGAPAGDDMSNVLYDKILAADIILFATPVNNFKMSSLMALFIDRCISLDGSLSPADLKSPKNRELNIEHSKFIQKNADPKIPGSGYLRRFVGKAAGIIVTGHEAGASLVISSLFMTLNHFGMIFAPFSTMYAMSSAIRPTHEDKKIVTGDFFVEEVKELASNVLSAAKLSKSFGAANWHYDNSIN
jgi:multimeric flavodoxin WrbA